MIKTLYIEKNTFKQCYAISVNEAIKMFKSVGIVSGFVKEIGTDNYIKF